MKHLPLTVEIRRRLADLARVTSTHRPGEDSEAGLELSKLALADAVLAALPKPTPATATLRFPGRRRA